MATQATNATKATTTPAAPANGNGSETSPEALFPQELVPPKWIQPHLISVQGGKKYLPAAFRILWFRVRHPDWGIETQLIEGGQEAGFATVQCRVYDPHGRCMGSGMKTETQKDFPAGWVEKAETGSIGRALSVIGFGTNLDPEMDEGGHVADSPRAGGTGGRAQATAPGKLEPGEVWEGPGQCPRCHAPEGKRHGKPCV